MALWHTLDLLVEAEKPRYVTRSHPTEDQEEQDRYDMESERLRERAKTVLTEMGLIGPSECSYPSRCVCRGIDVWGPLSEGSNLPTYEYRRTITF